MGCTNCNVKVTLTSSGGTGCGIEVSGGVAYSVGTQTINYTMTDPCSTVDGVLINGTTPPSPVDDGESITVTLNLKPLCTLRSTTVACQTFAFAQKFFKVVGNKVVVNRRAIAKHMLRLSRQK